MIKTGEMACGLNFSSEWLVADFSSFFDKLTVIGVDGDFMLQGKHEHKKQAWKGSNAEKNSSGHTSEQTGDEDNHGSNEHHEDTHEEEVRVAFVFHPWQHPITYLLVI